MVHRDTGEAIPASFVPPPRPPAGCWEESWVKTANENAMQIDKEA